MFGASENGPGAAWLKAGAQARARNAQVIHARPAAEREAINAGFDQLRADFAPEPAPQQPMHQHQQPQQPFLHGLVGGGGHAAPRTMYQDGVDAMTRAVDQTNDAWAKEMDRRSESARDAQEREKDMALAQIQAESEARHDEAMLTQDRERRGFLHNLLAGSGMVPHTVRFGG